MAISPLGCHQHELGKLVVKVWISQVIDKYEKLIVSEAIHLSAKHRYFHSVYDFWTGFEPSNGSADSWKSKKSLKSLGINS